MSDFVPKEFVSLREALGLGQELLDPELDDAISATMSELNALREHKVSYANFRNWTLLGPRRGIPRSEVAPFGEGEVLRIKELERLQHSLLERSGRTWLVLRQALGDCDLDCSALIPNGDLVAVPAKAWRSEKNSIVFERVWWWDPAQACELYGRPVIQEAKLARWLRSLKVTPTAGAEHRMTELLTTHMRASPKKPRSKGSMKAAAAAVKLVVSGRAFDRAWIKAAEQAKAPAWLLPGPRVRRSPP